MNKLSRESLGQVVRLTWMEWARVQPAPKPSWLVPWEELSEPEREVDRRIGEAIAEHSLAYAQVQELTTALETARIALQEIWDVCSHEHWQKVGAALEAIKKLEGR